MNDLIELDDKQRCYKRLFLATVLISSLLIVAILIVAALLVTRERTKAMEEAKKSMQMAAVAMNAVENQKKICDEERKMAEAAAEDAKKYAEMAAAAEKAAKKAHQALEEERKKHGGNADQRADNSAPGPTDAARAERWKKIEFDLSQLDKDGLTGPPDGKVALSYEFCIPNTDARKAEVKAIDRTVQFMPGSSGRIGSGKGECLCIGSTRADYRDVLGRLAGLPYVKRIIRCHFE